MSSYAIRHARSNGWWGMVIFVASEATLFGTMIGTYGYLRFQNAHWPPPSVGKPPVWTPLLLTLVLVSTSLPMQRAWSAARNARRAAGWRWLLAAFLVQTGYLVWQVHDFIDEVHRVKPQASAYASVYVTLLGTDHLHVLAGVLLNAWLLVRLWSRLTPYRLRGLHAITFYWHAVNVITTVVVLVQISPHA
jgi:heme/copper-type cytochrome/quinol oxidase subunit 3